MFCNVSCKKKVQARVFDRERGGRGHQAVKEYDTSAIHMYRNTSTHHHVKNIKHGTFKIDYQETLHLIRAKINTATRSQHSHAQCSSFKCYTMNN